MIPEWDNRPFISIVVPVYNGERTIRKCIESLQAQDYPAGRYEIIVVNNNSTDRTCEMVQAYPVRLLHERRLQTSYAARNRGILAAKGEIAACIDADCIAERNWLSELAMPFADTRVGAAGGEVSSAPAATPIERFLQRVQPFHNFQKFEGKFLNVLLAGNIAIRKSVFLALGGFRPNLYTIADIDFGWRLQLETGSQFVYVPSAVVYHVHRATLKGMFRQQQRAGFGRILLDAMYRKYAHYPYPPETELRRMGDQAIALLVYIRSAIYRFLTCWMSGKDQDYVLSPVLYFIAESANLLGKLNGLWATRFFQRDPSGLLIQDPGER